jgi:hypothetical protein
MTLRPWIFEFSGRILAQVGERQHRHRAAWSRFHYRTALEPDDGDRDEQRHEPRQRGDASPGGHGHRRGCCRGRDVGHLRDEPETVPVLGAQHRLALAVVPYRLASLLHGPGERRWGDAHARPQGVEQLVRGNDALAALDQVDEEVEDLRLDRDPLAALLEGPRFGL